MKKAILTSLAVFVFSILNAQWETKNYVDEFGDKTDESYKSLIANGTFSNSATTNSEALYSFTDSGDSMMITVYEYGSSKATSIEATFELVKIKTPSSGVVSFKRVFFTKGGSLAFFEKEYTRLIEVIKEKGNYTIIFDRSADYSKSSYKIKFTID
jgi:hypothetical protein